MSENILSLRPNRPSLTRYLDTYVNAARDNKQKLALLILRIQRGNELIALYGGGKVEMLMEEVALRLREFCREQDRIIRAGDFEIAMVLQNTLNEGHAMLAATKALRMLSVPFKFDELVIEPATCIGIAAFPDHALVSERLVQFAESALNDAESNRLPYSTYTERALEDIADIWKMEKELDAALANGEFEVYYQPKINLQTGSLAGAEALVRWRSPTRGLVLPDAFIPLATWSGRLRALTWSILNMALKHAAAWQESGESLTVAVNISPALLDDESLISRIADALAIWGTRPNQLILEITESAVMGNAEASFETIRALRTKGVSVSIDDFGTGHSSLANFRNMPATELKIDKSFVAKLCRSTADVNIVHTIIGLARAFKLEVAAEGVEDIETLRLLAAMGVNYAQGYVISRPLPATEFQEYMRCYRPPSGWPAAPRVADERQAQRYRRLPGAKPWVRP
jgi:diguanylate cyclase (GGDEF)-like protein